MVSDLQEAVDSVGPAKIAQAEAKAIRELKRDVEATIAGTQDSAVENGAGVANALRGLGKWLESTANTGGAGTPSDVPDTFRTPTASIHNGATITESQFNALISSIFKVTGSTSSLVLVADTALRTQISDYARTTGSATDNVRSVNYDGNSGSIKLSVDLYESDHGVVSIVNGNPDCMPDMSGGTANMSGYLVNPEYYGIHELIPMGSTRLPNLGGGERGFVDCALTLGVYHPGAHGKIVDPS